MSGQKSTQDNCIRLLGWQSASETQKGNIWLGRDFFTSKNKQCLSAAVFVPWGKTDRIPSNAFSTDLNVITDYLGRAVNAWLFPGLPCLQDKHYHKNSVLCTQCSVSMQPTSSHNTQTRNHRLSSPAPYKSGEAGGIRHLGLYWEQSNRNPMWKHSSISYQHQLICLLGF